MNFRFFFFYFGGLGGVLHDSPVMLSVQHTLWTIQAKLANFDTQLADIQGLLHWSATLCRARLAVIQQDFSELKTLWAVIDDSFVLPWSDDPTLCTLQAKLATFATTLANFRAQMWSAELERLLAEAALKEKHEALVTSVAAVLANVEEPALAAVDAVAPAALAKNVEKPVLVAVAAAHKKKRTVPSTACVVRKASALKAAAKVVKAHASPPFAKASTPLRKQCDTYLVHKPGLVHPIRSFTCLVASRGTRAKYKGDDVCAC